METITISLGAIILLWGIWGFLKGLSNAPSSKTDESPLIGLDDTNNW